MLGGGAGGDGAMGDGEYGGGEGGGGMGGTGERGGAGGSTRGPQSEQSFPSGQLITSIIDPCGSSQMPLALISMPETVVQLSEQRAPGTLGGGEMGRGGITGGYGGRSCMPQSSQSVPNGQL